MLKKIGICACLLLLLVPASGQQFVSLFDKYNFDNGRGYFRPLFFGIRQGLSTGYAFDPHIPKRSFRARFSLHGTATFFPASTRTYQATTDSYFTPEQSVEAPTVVGSREGVSVSGDGGAVYRFPGGAGIGMVPLAVPQLSIGGFLGIEMSWRLGYYQNPAVGRIILSGASFHFSLSQFFGPDPAVDLIFGSNSHFLAYSYLSEDLSDLRQFQQYEYGINLLAGKSWKPFRVYGGPNFSVGRSLLSVFAAQGSVDVNLNTGLQLNPSFTTGAGLDLHPFFLSVDGTFGRVTVVHTVIGVTLGKKEKTVPLIRTPLTPSSL